MEKEQCPYKLTKYRCQYGVPCRICIDEGNADPANECSVAVRHYNGNPWRTEKRVEFNKKGQLIEIDKV